MEGIRGGRTGRIDARLSQNIRMGGSRLCLSLVCNSDQRAQRRRFLSGFLGSGQAGLTVAARLKQLGVDALLIDQNARIGDNWRQRYHHLTLHDPVVFDHLPYMPFPNFWPKFTPKDKLADWFETYASSLELNCWVSTKTTSLTYDEGKKQWTVELDRTKDGKQQTRACCRLSRFSLR